MLRRAIIAAALTAATTLTAVVPALPAQARACMLDYHCVTTWYSDNTYTVVVGQKFEGCTGEESSWGRRSGHPEFVETPCF